MQTIGILENKQKIRSNHWYDMQNFFLVTPLRSSFFESTTTRTSVMGTLILN